jgi:Effector-associated domain 10/LGFP repeat
MTTPDRLQAIFERIANHQHTTEDVDELRRSLRQEGTVLQLVSQDGKFNTNVGQIVGGEVHIGDRTFDGANAEAIRQIIREELGRKRPRQITIVVGILVVTVSITYLSFNPQPPITVFEIGSDGKHTVQSFIKSYKDQGGIAKLGKPFGLRSFWKNQEGNGDGYIQDFSGGSEDQGSIILPSTLDKTFWVGGSFWRIFQSAPGIKGVGGVQGILVYPTSNRYPTKDGGWRQDFKGGAILKSSKEIFAVWGGIGEHYLKTEGGENGRLGFPTSRELGVGGGIKVHHFQNGCIRYDDNGSPTRTIMLPKEMLGNDDRCKNG